MLRKLFRRGGSGDDDTRRLEHPADLRAGDLLTFKHRLALPPNVQGQTFEVSSVATYEFEDGMYPELTLDGAEGGRMHLGFAARDPSELTLSRNVPRGDVLKLFDEAAFAALWEEDFANLEVVSALPEYEGWLAERYAQVKKWTEGYYHAQDRRGEDLSRHVDDGAEEFRSHECEDASGRYGLTVEVWPDGDTDVALEVNVPADVVESMWPGDGSGSSGNSSGRSSGR